MLDMTNISVPVPAWSDTIQRGDVVLFHLPCAEDGGKHPVFTAAAGP